MAGPFSTATPAQYATSRALFVRCAQASPSGPSVFRKANRHVRIGVRPVAAGIYRDVYDGMRPIFVALEGTRSPGSQDMWIDLIRRSITGARIN